MYVVLASPASIVFSACLQKGMLPHPLFLEIKKGFSFLIKSSCLAKLTVFPSPASSPPTSSDFPSLFSPILFNLILVRHPLPPLLKTTPPAKPNAPSRHACQSLFMFPPFQPSRCKSRSPDSRLRQEHSFGLFFPIFSDSIRSSKDGLKRILVGFPAMLGPLRTVLSATTILVRWRLPSFAFIRWAGWQFTATAPDLRPQMFWGLRRTALSYESQAEAVASEPSDGSDGSVESSEYETASDEGRSMVTSNPIE